MTKATWYEDHSLFSTELLVKKWSEMFASASSSFLLPYMIQENLFENLVKTAATVC